MPIGLNCIQNNKKLSAYWPRSSKKFEVLGLEHLMLFTWNIGINKHYKQIVKLRKGNIAHNTTYVYSNKDEIQLERIKVSLDSYRLIKEKLTD